MYATPPSIRFALVLTLQDSLSPWIMTLALFFRLLACCSQGHPCHLNILTLSSFYSVGKWLDTDIKAQEVYISIAK